MKLIKTKFLSLLTFFTLLIYEHPVLAANSYPVNRTSDPQTYAFAKKSGLNLSSRVGDIASMLIQAILGLLGIIFIALLIYAGFQWMTAEGNEEKVEKAKGTIMRAVIGLIIVIAAYSITYFVFNALNGAANGGGNVLE
jgi:hypothetical protein